MSGTSATTRNTEIARNPHPPEGLGRDGPISLLLLLADVPDIDLSSRLDLGSVALPTNVTVSMKVSTYESENLWEVKSEQTVSYPIHHIDFLVLGI